MIQSKKTQLISIRIPSKLKEGIQSIAMKNEATYSEVIRYALTKMLKNEK
tara:strand:- start:1231 stop:1380 length:150 start_codon:yes stop_codon:yes gene_type:complete